MAGTTAKITRGRALLLLVLMAGASIGTHLALLPAHPVSHCFHDELHYFQQARDVAHGGFPRYNRVFAPKYPPLYGTIQAAAWWIGGREGFSWWSRVINVLLFASTLIPIYRLARLELGRGWSVAAAGIALLLPCHFYVLFLLSESLIVPITAWATWLFARLARRPSGKRAAAVGIVLGLAMHTKMMMVVGVPTVFLALGWAHRSTRIALRYGGWATLATAVVVLPYVLRAHLFPSEAGAEVLFSYYGELVGGGIQPIATFLRSFRAEPSIFVVGLGAPVLLLALHGLFSMSLDTDPGRRGTGSWVLVLSALIAALVSVWIAQAAYYASAYHERYFLSLWPLFTVACMRQIARPERRLRPLLAALTVTTAMLLLVPDVILDPGSLGDVFRTVDVPSAPAVMQLTAYVGLPVGIRIVLALPMVLAVLVVFGPKTTLGRTSVAASLLVLIVAARAHSTIVAVERAHRAEQRHRAQCAPLWRWLDPIVAPDDRLVHHTFLGDFAYLNAIHFNQDLLVVQQDLTPAWQSGLRFDRDTGRYVLRGESPPGRLLLLTRSPGPVTDDVVSTLGEYRLVCLDRGLLALDHWLDPSSAKPRSEGVHPDRWCEPFVRFMTPAEYPKESEGSLILHHPADSPVSGPVKLKVLVRGLSAVSKDLTLEPGEQRTIRWKGMVWTPDFIVEIKADRWAVRNGRRLAFKVEGFMIRPRK